MTVNLNERTLLHITTVPESLYYFLDGQVRYMAQRGFNVHAISSPGPLLEKFGKRETVITHAVEMTRAISPFKDLISIWRLYTLFKKIKPTIVHAHTPKGGLLGMIAAFLGRVPVRIYHVHGLPYMTASGLKRMVLMGAERLSCRLAHRVFFVSESVRQIGIQDRICSAGKSKTINNGSINGVDALNLFNPLNADRDAARNAIGIPTNAKVIGFVGRMVCDKGIIELMTAWEAIRARHDNLYMLIVGPMEEKDAIPRELKDVISSDPRIRYAGAVSSPVSYYAAMDILVHPSHREGFGLVVLEASAMGLPVVATRIPGCIDSVREGETGILVPAKHATALEQAIITYLNSEELRVLHGKNGRKRALADFRPIDIWEMLRQEYDDMMRVAQLPFHYYSN